MALSKFVNPFLVGADPELVLLSPPNLVRGGQREVLTGGYYGFDHGGWVVEPHPIPDVSARRVCNNLRASLDLLTHQFGQYRFRAGAYIATPQRPVSLGGHVHLDLPALTENQRLAMDYMKATLENLDILPGAECVNRRYHGYGQCSDVRAEHGHVEYRSLCSWLFSRKTSMLSLTAIKLCAVAPETVPIGGFTSIQLLQNWLESFKDDDDDARWILEKDYFSKSMEANPDASVLDVWKTSAERGAAIRQKILDERVEERRAERAREIEQHAQARGAIRRIVAQNVTTGHQIGNWG